MTILKKDRGTHGMQNKCFWRVVTSWWPVLALLKSEITLKMGSFGSKKKRQNWVENVFFQE